MMFPGARHGCCAMPSLEQILQVYLDLADWHERHGPANVRDRFLILAADAALNAGREDEAERLRSHLLQRNPHHLLKPFASFAEALRSPDVASYVNDLKHSYPPEIARDILAQIRDGEAAPAPDEARSTLPIPPTLPVVDLDAPPDRPPRETPDPVVVYWDDTEPRPVPAPTPRPAKRPVPVKQPSRPTAVPRATTRSAAPPSPERPARPASASRPIRPLRTELPPTPASRATAVDDEDQPRATWVSSGLFGVLLLASLALLIYTLGRPLLPADWLPW